MNSERSIESIKTYLDVKFGVGKTRLRPISSEVNRLWCDNSLIKKLTGFKPKYSIEQGLKETIDWFSVAGNLKKYKADIYNV